MFGGTTAWCGPSGKQCKPYGKLKTEYCAGCNDCRYGVCTTVCDGSTCSLGDFNWCQFCASSGKWIDKENKCCSLDVAFRNWPGSQGCCLDGHYYSKDSDTFCEQCVNGTYTHAFGGYCCFKNAEAFGYDSTWCDPDTGACIDGEWHPECSDGFVLLEDTTSVEDYPGIVVWREKTATEGHGKLHIRVTSTSQSIATSMSLQFVNATIHSISDESPSYDDNAPCTAGTTPASDGYTQETSANIDICPVTNPDTEDIGDNLVVEFVQTGINPRAEINICDTTTSLLLATSELSYNCLLYTSPSPRD